MKDIILPNILELLHNEQNEAANIIQNKFRRNSLTKRNKTKGGVPSKSGSRKSKINSNNIKLEYLKIINCDLNKKILQLVV